LPVAAAVLTDHEPALVDDNFDEVSATYVANILIEELELRDEPSTFPLDSCRATGERRPAAG
jgi:hypothetical protein